MGTVNPGDYSSPNLDLAFHVARLANAERAAQGLVGLRYIPVSVDGSVMVYDIVDDMHLGVPALYQQLPLESQIMGDL